ncbi:hypothetical protein EMIT0158MI4_100072 [Burkholderia ambifaria]
MADLAAGRRDLRRLARRAAARARRTPAARGRDSAADPARRVAHVAAARAAARPSDAFRVREPAARLSAADDLVSVHAVPRHAPRSSPRRGPDRAGRRPGNELCVSRAVGATAALASRTDGCAHHLRRTSRVRAAHERRRDVHRHVPHIPARRLPLSADVGHARRLRDRAARMAAMGDRRAVVVLPAGGHVARAVARDDPFAVRAPRGATSEGAHRDQRSRLRDAAVVPEQQLSPRASRPAEAAVVRPAARVPDAARRVCGKMRRLRDSRRVSRTAGAPCVDADRHGRASVRPGHGVAVDRQRRDGGRYRRLSSDQYVMRARAVLHRDAARVERASARPSGRLAFLTNSRQYRSSSANCQFHRQCAE